MKVSYNWLKEYVKNLPKPEKLVDLLTMHSFEVKNMLEVRLPTGESDFVLDTDILPNRAHDCLCHIGIARECSALLNSKFEYQNPKLVEDKKLKTTDFLSVEVEDTELCPRYTARVITDAKIGPSPKWMQERLRTLEQKPINNIVDATNYLALELGQPLHAFDAEKLTGKKIIVRRAKKGEKIITLDGEKCDLDKDILVIADSRDPVAIAGIKGGKKAEITSNTKTIILESANFNQYNIHKSSRKLGIATESSLRFEHGLDPNLASQAIDRLVILIHKLAGGKIAKGMIDVYSRKITPKKIAIKLSKTNSLLGIKIPKKEIIRIFNLLGFKVEKKIDHLLIEVPTRRLDIEIPEDLIEEIGRIYGYERILPKPPIGILVSPKVDDLLRLRNKVKDILEGLGLVEVYNYSFVEKGDLELENPLSSDLKYLRQDLIAGLLKNTKDNFRFFKEVRLFELGKIYLKNDNEKTMLAGALGRKTGNNSELFYEAKGIVEGLLNKLGITDQQISDKIKIGNQDIGFIKAINHQVAIFNIDFETLAKLISEELIYQPPSKYPAVIRDIAVLVNFGDRVADVLNVINGIGEDLIQDVDLFDMYEGEEIPGGKKNLAFHIIYQAQDRTLTDEEVDKIHIGIVKALERRMGWEVRK